MLRRLALGLALIIMLASCGDDTGSAAPTTAGVPYPPQEIEALGEIFDPHLEPLGVRITRGGLIDRTGGGYEPSPEGNHLALYVEPIDDDAYDTADYVQGLGTVTALVTPMVFDRWSEIETYDICQEPPADVDSSDTPAPYTQIEIDRTAAESVDWDEADASTVIELGRTAQMRLVVTPVIREHPAYAAADPAA